MQMCICMEKMVGKSGSLVMGTLEGVTSVSSDLGLGDTLNAVICTQNVVYTRKSSAKLASMWGAVSIETEGLTPPAFIE